MIVQFLDKGVIQKVVLDMLRRGVEADPQPETFECLHGHSLHENGNGSTGQEPTSDCGEGGIYRSERCLPTWSYSQAVLEVPDFPFLLLAKIKMVKNVSYPNLCIHNLDCIQRIMKPR